MIIGHAAWDDIPEEKNVNSFLFKCVEFDTIKEVFTELHKQQLFSFCNIRDYKPAILEGNHRTGYINEGVMVDIFSLKLDQMPIPDFKQTMKELFFIKGVDLQFITYNQISNLKAIYK